MNRLHPLTFVLLIGLAVAVLGNAATHAMTWLGVNLFALFYDDWLLIGLFVVMLVASFLLGRARSQS
ncbi:MAG TPA: hypothetical protein VGJ60_07215 [Chloroflexota bacterium]